MGQMAPVQTVWLARWPPRHQAATMHSLHIRHRALCQLPPRSKYSTM